MANATSRLLIQIDAKNNSSGALKQTETSLRGIDNAAKMVSGGLAGLAGAAGVGALVSLGQAAASAVFDMARLAATAADVETAFNTMAADAGASSDQMFAGLKEASRGAISDTELMLNANRAMLLGVADSTEEMTALMDVARASSQAMGTTTAAAFQDLVRGIGTGQRDLIDNLGISISLQQAYAAYAQEIGKVVSELTDQERRQAILNAVMRESADLVKANEEAGDDVASNYERMDAAISNAKEALGELFTPAVVAIADAMAKAAAAAAEGMKEMAETPPPAAETAYYAAQAHAAAENTKAFGDAAEAASGFFAPLVDYIREGQQAYARARSEATGAAVGIEESATAAAHASYEIRSLTAIMGSAISQFNALGATASRALSEAALMANLAQEAFANLRAEQADLTNQIEDAAKASGVLYGAKQGGEAGLGRQQAVTDELNAQREIWEDMNYDTKQINEVLMPAYIDQLRAADQATFRVATGTAKISDEAREAERAFSELESTVAGVLRGALDPGVGVDPDELLEKMGIPRADAINENARRLADIAAHGLKGQDWLDEFQKEVPDIWRMIRTAQNPQEEAAYLLRDFQDGLLSAPIDKGMVKETVKRMIRGDENMASLATEIAHEIAGEMNIPLQQALAATRGAMGGGGIGGSELAQNFTDGATQGLTEAGGGTMFVDTFVEQMRSRYSLLSTAGRDAGKMWGESFIAAVGDNVPAPLITLLTELVTPGVFAKFAQQGSLTGSAP